MKWLCAVLLLFNAGLFLWAMGHQRESAPTRPTVNVNTMRLIGENLSRPTDAKLDTICYRIGPFYTELGRDRSVQKLKALDLAFTSQRVNAREIRAYRVYLGPFENASEIAAQRTLLENGGISDHYVKRDDNGQDVISLGLFSQLSGAEALIVNLKAKGIVVKRRVEDRRLGPTHWLEVRESAKDPQARTILGSTQWGDARTRLIEFACS